MRSLLAEDQEEDRAIFEEMFGASFLDQATDLAADD
jgi:hypothetical protein